jgi:hypothetical protein
LRGAFRLGAEGDHPLRHAIFPDLEVTGSQAGYMVTLLVGDHHGHQDLPNFNLDGRRWNCGLLRGGDCSGQQGGGMEHPELARASMHPGHLIRTPR